MQWWFFSISNYVIYYKSVNYIILNNKTGGRNGLTVLPFFVVSTFQKNYSYVLLAGSWTYGTSNEF